MRLLYEAAVVASEAAVDVGKVKTIFAIIHNHSLVITIIYECGSRIGKPIG